MSEDQREITWTRLPGRRWRVTIWQPGEREWATAMHRAVSNYRPPPVSVFQGVCPTCGGPRHIPIAPPLYGALGPLHELFGL